MFCSDLHSLVLTFGFCDADLRSLGIQDDKYYIRSPNRELNSSPQVLFYDLSIAKICTPIVKICMGKVCDLTFLALQIFPAVGIVGSDI